MKRTVRTLGGVLVAGALLLGACSSSGGEDEAEDTTTTEAEETTTTEAEETTTTEAEVDEDAMARAEMVDLTVDDFPEGWTAEPSDTSDDDDAGISDCAPVMADDSAVLARYDTDDFTTGDLDAGDGTNFAASTKVFVDEDAAQAVLDPFSEPDVIACIDEELKKVFGDGTGTDIEGEMAEDDLDVGTDAAEGISGEYVVPTPDGELPLNVAVLLFRTGDIATMVTLLSVGSSLDPSTLEAPLFALVERQMEA
jgi:hypothetical protein